MAEPLPATSLRPPSDAEQLQRLRHLAGEVAPVSLAGDKLVPAGELVAPLLPARALRRGTVVTVEGAPGSGATSLLLHLVSGASREGSWIAVVGMPGLGAVAAAEANLDLDRLALVPEPGGNWPLVTAALLDAIDVVVLRPATRVRPQDARKLATRARDRGGVLVVSGHWPEGADVRLTTTRARWAGIANGHGCLRDRAIEVVAGGRGAASRERRTEVAL